MFIIAYITAFCIFHVFLNENSLILLSFTFFLLSVFYVLVYKSVYFAVSPLHNMIVHVLMFFGFVHSVFRYIIKNIFFHCMSLTPSPPSHHSCAPPPASQFWVEKILSFYCKNDDAIKSIWYNGDRDWERERVLLTSSQYYISRGSPINVIRNS